MKRAKVADSQEKLPAMRPALTPEAKEGQMISLAMDVCEQRMRNGTASSQEIIHFLKLGSMREKLEREKLEHENRKLQAQKEALEANARVEELYANAIAAMKRYSGHGSDSDYENVF